jgi:hypothetical protein
MPDSDHIIAQSHIELEKRIRERAHQIWVAHHQGKDRGDHGALEDWLQAEREVLGDDGRHSAQNRGTTVGDAHVPDRGRMPETGGLDSARAESQLPRGKSKRATTGDTGRKTRGASAGDAQEPDQTA